MIPEPAPALADATEGSVAAIAARRGASRASRGPAMGWGSRPCASRAASPAGLPIGVQIGRAAVRRGHRPARGPRLRAGGGLAHAGDRRSTERTRSRTSRARHVLRVRREHDHRRGAPLFPEGRPSKLTPAEAAHIGFWVGLPWSMKMVAGVATDRYPILGSRRKPYLLLGALISVLGYGVASVGRHDQGRVSRGHGVGGRRIHDPGRGGGRAQCRDRRSRTRTRDRSRRSGAWRSSSAPSASGT